MTELSDKQANHTIWDWLDEPCEIEHLGAGTQHEGFRLSWWRCKTHDKTVQNIQRPRGCGYEMRRDDYCADWNALMRALTKARTIGTKEPPPLRRYLWDAFIEEVTGADLYDCEPEEIDGIDWLGAVVNEGCRLSARALARAILKQKEKSDA